MDAIGNHIEVSIDQIGCETGINLSKAKQNNFKEYYIFAVNRSNPKYKSNKCYQIDRIDAA